MRPVEWTDSMTQGSRVPPQQTLPPPCSSPAPLPRAGGSYGWGCKKNKSMKVKVQVLGDFCLAQVMPGKGSGGAAPSAVLALGQGGSAPAAACGTVLGLPLHRCLPAAATARAKAKANQGALDAMTQDGVGCCDRLWKAAGSEHQIPTKMAPTRICSRGRADGRPNPAGPGSRAPPAARPISTHSAWHEGPGTARCRVLHALVHYGLPPHRGVQSCPAAQPGAQSLPRAQVPPHPHCTLPCPAVLALRDGREPTVPAAGCSSGSGLGFALPTGILAVR